MNLGNCETRKGHFFLVKITDDKSNTMMYIFYFGISSERAAGDMSLKLKFSSGMC